MKTKMNDLFTLTIALLLLTILPSNNIGNKESFKTPSDEFSFKYLGKLKCRHANEIQASKISVGAEMMDRDFTIYKNWKEYLGPLGVKKARIQSGWAKCEKQKGVYNWAWLDEIIFDMADQGVEPWVNLSYGNTIYTGGGGTTIFSKALPNSSEAMEGWINYVKQIVVRYKHIVDEWEIWNEPNYEIDNEEYALFLIRTAEVIKEIQPKSKVLALGLGSHVDYKFADKVLEIIYEHGKIHLIDEVTHHRHIPIPEFNEPEIELEKVLRKYSDKIVARQGEAGCPSTEMGDYFAMRNNDWTEIQQAKMVLKRLMSDLGRGKETSVFTIIDALYTGKKGEPVWNTKGLIKATDDLKVDYLKPAYYAVQNVTSIFDNSLKPVPHFSYETDKTEGIVCFMHENVSSRKQAVAIWKGNKIADLSTKKETINLTIHAGNFTNPVWIDLRTGEVYNIPESKWSRKGNTFQFEGIPFYDSPVLIADKSLILIKTN